jgi:hypothetical protein
MQYKYDQYYDTTLDCIDDVNISSVIFLDVFIVALYILLDVELDQSNLIHDLCDKSS